MREGGQGGATQVGVDGTDGGASAEQHVLGAGDTEGGDGCAAGEALEDDQPEGVGSRREDEDVGAGERAGELGAVTGAGEQHLRMGTLQGGPRRAVADDDLAAWQVEREEGADVFFRPRPGRYRRRPAAPARAKAPGQQG